MKINHTNNINFNGIYVIKGASNTVKILEKSLEDRFHQEYNSNNPKALYQYNGIYILPKNYTPQTQLLVATNEDAKPLVNFIGKNYKLYNFITYPKHDTPYKEARSHIEAAFRNNPDTYLDLMLEEQKGISYNPIKEARQFIAHLAYEQNVNVKDIKCHLASDISKAIADNCFDFVKGIVKTAK